MHLSDTFLNLRNTADQPEVIVEYREETSHHSTGNSFSELLQWLTVLQSDVLHGTGSNTTFTYFSTKLRDLWLD